MNLVKKLREDFGQFSFVLGEVCRWSPAEKTIFYTKKDPAKLLHELGHALLGHADFTQDIELLHIERDAWEKARELGDKYGVKITENQIENALDSYREWLHQRSCCPNCRQNGFQSRSDGLYRCLNCNTVWNTNDGRKARIHRYIQK